MSARQQPTANVIDTTASEDEVANDAIEPLDPDVAGSPQHAAHHRITEQVQLEPDPAPPLTLPNPPDAESIAAVQKLDGYSTSVDWLPEGLSDEIDAIRARHIDLIDRVARCLADMESLRRKYAMEDRGHDLAARAAIRAGQSPPPDETTPAGERYAEVERAAAPLWPLVVVLSEVVLEAEAALKAAEPQLLGELGEELNAATAKRQEAQRLVDEARREEWQISRTATWIHNVVDGRAFSHQPRPRLCDPPPSFDGEDIDLQRPWWKS